jgi:hypothetical protein
MPARIFGKNGFILIAVIPSSALLSMAPFGGEATR